MKDKKGGQRGISKQHRNDVKDDEQARNKRKRGSYL